ncbi:MAG: aorA [Amycolatopsis sp.]|jgi:GntR family transcriptional regulator|uniref:GntR family transcriptional regulator n=1 Tax=Amycolatopsis sp. TaxID=37632 RepID=UPI0026115571|nr:GntR family transcriptional regulator [Amycolatopsis sp.]MCU1685216.1 aorA [Amycolatopsis sp.]
MAHRYLDIADDLRQRLSSGEFPVGTKLPGMNQLAVHYGAHNDEVHEAVIALELEGRVATRSRSGTIVLPGDAELHQLDLGVGVSRNDLGYVFPKPAGHWPGLPGTYRREWLGCPVEIAELLDITEDEQVLCRSVVVGPGWPMQLTRRYFPQDLAAGTILEAEDTGPGGVLDRLEQDLNHGPLDWSDTFVARMPTAEEATALTISPRLPVMVTFRTHTSPAGRVVAADEIVRDARRFKITVPVHREPSAHWPVQPVTGRNTAYEKPTRH